MKHDEARALASGARGGGLHLDRFLGAAIVEPAVETQRAKTRVSQLAGLTGVFDEVDAGIGGQTARAVGEQLRALAEGRQVICITHLPQIASLADRHFTIVKDTSAGTTRTTVTQLRKGDVVGELVRMLGADREDAAARRHAQELLKAA